jgi:cytidylate kinase
MNEGADDVTAVRSVTISREYASGGHDLAAQVADRLGWQLLDHDAMVGRVVESLGTSQAEAEAHDERHEGLVAKIVRNLQYIDPDFEPSTPLGATVSDEADREAVDNIVQAAAERGQVVIVGRASQVTLSGRRDVLRVRIIAPIEQRIAAVMQQEGLNRQEATSRIRGMDREHVKYLKAEYHQELGDAHLYDLVVNMGFIAPEMAVNVICLLLSRQ